MKVAGSHTVPVVRQRLWDSLHDPDLLRRALPGCSSLQGHEAGRYTATVHVNVPCVEGLYHADILVAERDAPGSLTLTGSLAGQPGSGRGRARLDLDDDGDATTIRYDLEAEVTGSVSRVGRRLLESAIKRTIADHLDAVAVAAGATATHHLASEGVSSEPQPDAGSVTEPATVTFAPARLRGAQIVTAAVAAMVAVVAFWLGRRSAR